jgi:TonB family protein
MRRATLFLLIAFALPAVASPKPPLVEERNGVPYYPPDWSHLHISTDVTPSYPSGGMQAFTSYLDYPAEYRHKHIGGTVTLNVSWDSSGHVTSAKVTKSVHPALDSIALRAVRQIHWMPARKAGKPIPISFPFPITFAPPKT